MTPFDQIYWYSPGGMLFEDPGEWVRGSEVRGLVGKTANGNPDSAFSYPTTYSRSVWGNESTETAAVWGGGVPTSDHVKEVESKSIICNPTLAEDLDDLYMGFHIDENPVTVTWPDTKSKSLNGARVIMEIRKEVIHADMFVGAGTPLYGSHNYAASDVNARRVEIATSEFAFMNIGVYKHSEGDAPDPSTDLQKPQNFIEYNGEQTFGDGTTKTIESLGNVSKSGNTVTFASIDPREYFFEGFKIKINTTEYTVSSVSSTTVTTTAGGNHTSTSSWSILIPAGSPDTSYAPHVNDHSLSATLVNSATSSNWAGKTWGFCLNKYDTAGTERFETNTRGEDNPVDGWVRDAVGSDGWYIRHEATKSPFFSSKEFHIRHYYWNSPEFLDPTDTNVTNYWSDFNVGEGPYNNSLYRMVVGQSDEFESFELTSKSSAIWPNYQNNIRALTAGTSAGQINDDGFGPAGAFGLGYGPSPDGINTQGYGWWDQTRVSRRIHGEFMSSLGSMYANIVPHNSMATSDTDANKKRKSKAFWRNLYYYPYLLGVAGYFVRERYETSFREVMGDIDPPSGEDVDSDDNSDFADSGVGDPFYFTVWETDDIITPGTSFSVTAQVPFVGSQNQSGEAQSDETYAKDTAIYYKVKLILMAKN